MDKTLDRKLSQIHSDPACTNFILADAKDADMALGLTAPGRDRKKRRRQFRSLPEYRQTIREIVQEVLIDICLMSASTNELLAIDEKLFDHSHVTPAVRMNDTTDIWLAGCNGGYGQQPSLPFSYDHH